MASAAFYRNALFFATRLLGASLELNRDLSGDCLSMKTESEPFVTLGGRRTAPIPRWAMVGTLYVKVRQTWHSFPPTNHLDGVPLIGRPQKPMPAPPAGSVGPPALAMAASSVLIWAWSAGSVVLRSVW